MDTAVKKNPELWSKAKSEAKAQLGGKWSARAAQLAVQKYKAQGGKYQGKKPSPAHNSLAHWTKQDWQTRPGTPEKAERGGVTHRYLPKAKWESLSKKEQVATDRKKVEGDRRGQQIVPNTPKARVKSAKAALGNNLRDNFEAKLDGTRWTGAVNNDGYPKIKQDGKLRLASHVALELAGRKAPPAGKVVMHKDNNPRNLAVSNLRVATQKDNLKHMRDQGRDRPRGVDQEPDVKRASWAAFSDELQKILF